jgi:predicted Rossmann-fold nucleotide-binding protein
MESYPYDLATPDGAIVELKTLSPSTLEATVFIANISPAFAGYQIEKEHIFFNIKSTLAQAGINGICQDFHLEKGCAEVRVLLSFTSPLGARLLPLLEKGAYIGKLFAADPRRRVRDPSYLRRMFGRADRQGTPLLFFGGELPLEKKEGRTIAYLPVRDGIVRYDAAMEGFLPTLAKALKNPHLSLRGFLSLHQLWQAKAPRQIKKDELLLVKTAPLHVRTVFGRVVDSLLPKGVRHTTASVLEPTTTASGDIYELFGSASDELSHIPLEFYTLEPTREYVFFEDRDQLQAVIDDPKTIFSAFETAPKENRWRAAVFVVKGELLLKLQTKDWICREVFSHDFPGLIHHQAVQAQMVARYIEQQPSYPILKAIEEDQITSEGALFTKYFPSPVMKKMLLSDFVQAKVKRLYFQYPSQAHGDFFSHEDRSFLLDLAKFAIPVYWADTQTCQLLQFVPKPEKDAGLFVPLAHVDAFQKSASFGIYGSNLHEGNFEKELTALMEGLKELRPRSVHPLFNKETPIALITGGGPGVMEVGNRVARATHVLSCANVIDFRSRAGGVVNEQKQNRYIDAKMTYRLDRLVERQAEFNLDFPIFLAGGIGTDFEFALEEVRRKVGVSPPTPVLLFGAPDYWSQKLTARFQINLKSGAIAGSEWVSNCFYCVQTAAQGLAVYERFFAGSLAIGKDAPACSAGFCRA